MEATLLISDCVGFVSAALCSILLPLSLNSGFFYLLILPIAQDSHQPRACMVLRLHVSSPLTSNPVSEVKCLRERHWLALTSLQMAEASQCPDPPLAWVTTIPSPVSRGGGGSCCTSPFQGLWPGYGHHRMDINGAFNRDLLSTLMCQAVFEVQSNR